MTVFGCQERILPGLREGLRWHRPRHRRRPLSGRLEALILVWTLALLSAWAHAALLPETYNEARRTASLHLQVEVIGVVRPEKTPGECGVEGKVIAIFRDEFVSLQKGDSIAFSISCSSNGDDLPFGPAQWTNVERLARAKYLEVYLNRDGDRYKVALWQSKIIDGPTAAPTVPVLPAK